MSPQEQKYYNETILPRLLQLKLSPNSSYGLQVSDMMLTRYRLSLKNLQRVQQNGTNLKPQMLDEVTVTAPKLTAKTVDNSDTTPLTKGTSWTSELDNETKTVLGNGVSYDATKARSGEREALAAANKVGLGLGAIGLSVAAAPVIGNAIGAMAPHAMQLGYKYIPKAMHYLNYISPGTSEFFSMSTPLQLGVGLMDAATTAGAVSNFIDNPGFTSGVEAAISTLPYYSAFRTQKLLPKFGASKFQHNVTNFTNSVSGGNSMPYLANLIQGGDDEIKLFSMLKSNSPSINYDELMKLFNNLTPEQLNELQKVGFDLELFLKNVSEMPRTVQNLLNKNYYHDAITGDDLIREFLKLGKPDEPVNINKELIGNFYTNDVWHRLMRNLKEQGIKLTKEQINELKSIVTTPWEGVDMKYGYTQPGSGGYSYGPHKIRFRFGFTVPDNTVVHELHHSYRDRLATFFRKHHINIGDVNKIMSEDLWSTKDSRKKFQQDFPEYLGNELEAMKPFKFNSEDLSSLTPTAEQGATIAELRFKLFNEFLRQHGRIPSVKELDFIIDKMAKEGYLLNGTSDYTLINTSYGSTFHPNFFKRKDEAVNNAKNITAEKLAKRDISDKPEWFSLEEWENILNKVYPKRKWWQLTKPKVGFDEYEYNDADFLARIRSESKERRLINHDIANGLKRVAGYTIPITIGADAISSEKNGGQLIERHYDGGAVTDWIQDKTGMSDDTMKKIETGASFLPIVGTIMDGYELIKNPSWENAAYFGLSLGSDLLGGKIIGKAIAKGAKATKAAKAAKATGEYKKMIKANRALRGIPVETAAKVGAVYGTDAVINTIQNSRLRAYKRGGQLKLIKKSFEDWYKTVPTDRNDTITYNLRRAYELAPIDELETWRTSSFEDLKSGKNHLGTVYFNPDTGIYEFVKSKDHESIQSELDWFYSDDPEAIEFRNNYYLDTSNDFYKYIPKKKSGGRIHIKPENRGKFTEYCGGKVTDECIQRAKRSGNKKLIKRAVFAENARKWKH